MYKHKTNTKQRLGFMSASIWGRKENTGIKTETTIPIVNQR